MALFLFSVFVMFAVFSWVGGPLGPVSSDGVTPAQAQAARTQAEARLRSMEADRAARAARGENVSVLDRQIAVLRGTLRQVSLSSGRTADGVNISVGARETGIAWLDDHTLIYPGRGGDQLRRVDAGGGGDTTAWSHPDFRGYGLLNPTPLPDGRGVFFLACTSGCATTSVVAADLRTGRYTELLDGASVAVERLSLKMP
jgi:hypothetical protein